MCLDSVECVLVLCIPYHQNGSKYGLMSPVPSFLLVPCHFNDASLPEENLAYNTLHKGNSSLVVFSDISKCHGSSSLCLIPAALSSPSLAGHYQPATSSGDGDWE